MPVETATYISDLVASNPAHSDPLSAGDSHMRLIKAALKATFPNVNAAVTSTPAALSAVGTPGTSGAPSVNFGATTEGLYKIAAGQIGVIGQVIGNGAVERGAILHCICAPTNSTSGGNSSSTKYSYLRLDGGTYLCATYPELASAYLNVAIGSLPTNFTLPNATDTGRFLRSHFSGMNPNQAAGNQLGAHNHTATFAGTYQPGHTHPVAGFNDPGHNHYSVDPGQAATIAGAGISTVAGGSGGTVPSTAFDIRGARVTSVATTGITFTIGAGGDFTPAGTVAVGSTGSSETRPECLAVLMYVKT